MLSGSRVFPIGSGDNLSHAVAEVIDKIDRAGLPDEVTAMDNRHRR